MVLLTNRYHICDSLRATLQAGFTNAGSGRSPNSIVLIICRCRRNAARCKDSTWS